MRRWLLVAIGLVTAAGCEAPSEPAPAAQSDPLEEAIARGHYPEPVAGFLRRLATLPPGTSEDAALKHLGLTDEAEGGYALEEHEFLFWHLAPGYQVAVAVHLFPGGNGPPAVVDVRVTAEREPGNPDAESTQVFPYWGGGRLRYE